MLSNSTEAEGTETAEQKGYLSDQCQYKPNGESTGGHKQRDVRMWHGTSRTCRHGQWSPP